MSTYEAFRREFKGDLVAPGDPDYSEALARWSNNAIRKAKLVAFVKDSRDVSLAIKYATSIGLPIAIRGGGHSVAGSSSREDGFVIDLSKYLNGARVDPEKKLIFVGGGTTWATVDKSAIEHGLATVGGTVNHVCIFENVFRSNANLPDRRCRLV